MSFYTDAPRHGVALVLALILVAVSACGGGDPTGAGSNPPPEPPAPPPAPVITSVTVTTTAPRVRVGSTVTAQAVARTADGTAVNATFSWSTGTESVASITPTGTVRGRTAGSTSITARVGNVSGSTPVAVDPLDINALVDSVRTARGLPAMAGAIVSRQGIVALGVAGTRRAGGGPPVTLEDRWHIGSNLKAITAALAAVAVREGRLAWTTTVGQSFPELGQAIRPEHRNVTLQDLLANRGGIRNDPPGSAYAGTSAKAQRESMAGWALSAAPVGSVGQYHYSNPGFIIAGAMIERAWGGTFEDLLDARLTGPLGVTGLGWGPTTPAGTTSHPVGHRLQGAVWTPCEGCDNPPGLSSAGRAHMRLLDWALVVQEFLKADSGTSALVAPADGRLLFTGATPLPGSNDQYALGWNMTTRPWGGRTAQHSGSNLSNNSVAWLGLDTGVAFLALTNAADLNPGGTGVALDQLVGGLLRTWQGLN